MSEDTELLRRYTRENSEAAFAELVQRHVNFVYGCALRRVGGDAHRAEDVTQQVFTALARNAASLARHPVLTAWLFTTTRNTAAQTVRAERRRQAREQEAQIMNETDSVPEAEWQQLRAVLDEAMDRLGEADRQAVLLRFFEGKTYADVAARLRLNENAARMRVERALTKMHATLTHRGVVSTSAALTAALASHAAGVAPAGFAAGVASAALSGGGAALAGAAAGTAAGGAWVTFMSMTKLQVGITSVFAIAGATGLAVQTQTNAALRTEVANIRQENAAIAPLRAENLRLARAAVEIAELRKDDAELDRLRNESAALQDRLKAVARLEQAHAGAGSQSEIYDISKLDRQPRVRFQPRPQYPLEMRGAGTTGQVVVDFVVDANGEVRNAYAVHSSQKEFESAAVQAVSQWKFDAGLKRGRNVNTHMQVPIVFTLSGKPAPSEPPPKAGARASNGAVVELSPFVVESK